MEAIEVARTQHWQDLSESASALKNYLELVQEKSGAWTIDAWFVTVDERDIECLEWPVGEYVLKEEDRRDLQPVNHGEYLLEHLKVEFPEYRWPSEWYFLRIKEIRNIMDKLSLVSARRTFENAVCSVCETWQSTPRREEMPSSEAVNRYLASCEAVGLSKNTLEMYASTLKRYIEANPSQLPTDPPPIEVFLNQFTAGNSRLTHFKVIKGFHRFLYENYDIANPMNKMKTPKVKKTIPDSLSQEEVIKLFNQPMSDRDRTALMVMVGCGIRVGEAVNLKFSDIEDEQLKVSGKTGARNVPLRQDIRQSLLSLRNGHKDDDPIFWGEHPHQPLREAGFQGLVKKAFQQAGITGKRASPHTLRHTFGRLWTDKGGDVVSLKEIMGHFSLEMTQRYTNLSPNEIISKNKQFNPLISISDEGITSDDQSLTSDDQSLTTLDKDLTQC